jgi:hypothetical protein
MSEELLHPALPAEDPRYDGIDVLDSDEKGDLRGGDLPGDLAAIKRFLSVETRVSYQDEGDLRKIMDFASRQGVVTDADLGVWLKELSLKLGTPSLGETRVKQMIHYLDLDDRINSLVREQSAYVR